MKTLRTEKLSLLTMASGHLCLNFTESVGWGDFPAYADELLRLLNGSVESKADGVELCIWKVRFGGCELRLVYEDYPTMISLESSTDEGDSLLVELHRELEATRGLPPPTPDSPPSTPRG
jgi:hypothetical protein